jgi:hypothetical protein
VFITAVPITKLFAGEPGTQLCVNELSCDGTTPRHATTPEIKTHHHSGTPEVNASLYLTPR